MCAIVFLLLCECVIKWFGCFIRFFFFSYSLSFSFLVILWLNTFSFFSCCFLVRSFPFYSFQFFIRLICRLLHLLLTQRHHRRHLILFRWYLLHTQNKLLLLLLLLLLNGYILEWHEPKALNMMKFQHFVSFVWCEFRSYIFLSKAIKTKSRIYFFYWAERWFNAKLLLLCTNSATTFPINNNATIRRFFVQHYDFFKKRRF